MHILYAYFFLFNISFTVLLFVSSGPGPDMSARVRPGAPCIKKKTGGCEELLFLKNLFLLKEMPFVFWGVSKTWDPKKWILWALGFAMIHNMTVSSLFFKTYYFSCRRCPLGSGGVHMTWGPRNILLNFWALQ